jgi:hypothetical protein
MTTYHVKSHAVEGSKIVRIQPLMGRNDQLMSPESGLVLVLDDATKHKWLGEKDGAMPSVGDFLVKDDALNVIYVVAADKFSTLFRGPRP